jgi:hypothetical protein
MKKNKSLCACLLLSFFIFINTVSAQVPVRDEPRHKMMLENDYVRLIEVHIPVHDTTLTHIHATPSVIVFLSKSTIGTQIVGDKPVISEVNPGATSYAAYDEKPITHRVWNQGESLFHVMDIELPKQNPNKDTSEIISQPGVKFQWQKKLVRVYNLDINEGVKLKLPKSNCAYLLIDISGKATTSFNGKKLLKTGDFIFFPPQSNIEINNDDKQNASCVLLELK